MNFSTNPHMTFTLNKKQESISYSPNIVSGKIMGDVIMLRARISKEKMNEKKKKRKKNLSTRMTKAMVGNPL